MQILHLQKNMLAIRQIAGKDICCVEASRK